MFIRQGKERSQCTTQAARKCYGESMGEGIGPERGLLRALESRQTFQVKGGDQPLWQLGHCLASNLSGETRNILLHWMQTRWITELTTASGRDNLTEPVGWELGIFSAFV